MKIKVGEDGRYVPEFEFVKDTSGNSDYYNSPDHKMIYTVQYLVRVRGAHMLLDKLYEDLHTKYGVDNVKDGLDMMTPGELIEYLKNLKVEVPLYTDTERKCMYYYYYNPPADLDTSKYTIYYNYDAGHHDGAITAALLRLDQYCGNKTLGEVEEVARDKYPINTDFRLS